ncbi:unnamed protein product [Spirodela intermedia]|uniref:Uncharacterized protein n=1 Tax=Spirodela intermedia TaxID=51605 RepID=A0ABN7EC82_SPIIN|nr:unnamed protein product [Spirodela intermedia]
MVRSLCQAARMATAFTEHAGVFLTRRGRGPGRVFAGGVSSWGPDPVTGDYRPGSRAAEVDVAELRRRVLPH